MMPCPGYGHAAPLRTCRYQTLRLTEEETEALRRQAEREHRSMQEVARLAILERIQRDERIRHVRRLASEVATRHARLLDRLAE